MDLRQFLAGLAIYLFVGYVLAGSMTRDSWLKCQREITIKEQVLMTTMWAPAMVFVVLSMPFDKQPEKSCFSD